MKQWVKTRPVEALVIATLALALLFGGRNTPPAVEPAIANLQNEVARVDTVLASADSLEKVIYRRDSQLAVARAQRNAHADSAKTAREALDSAVSRFSAKESEDTVLHAEANQLLAQAVEVIQHLEYIVYEDSVALERADELIGIVVAVNHSLYNGLLELRNAADSAARAVEGARPKWYARLKPQVGVGIAAGVDTQGRPNTLAGITVGWRLR